ncbi:MAG: exo-alpha-sialidase [Bacteroidetes bacterium]|nr:exo-alpha-sialidase [Bacteroidota bacterium]
MTVIISIILTILISSAAFPQFPSYRLHPSQNNQIEPAIVVHPTNPDIMFASAFTIRLSFKSEGVYLSTNGGQTWTGTDTCFGQPLSNHGGDPGPIIDKDGNLILSHQGGFILGMYSNTSTDFGQSWTNNYQIAGNDQDKGSPATDNNPMSPYFGRTFLVWTKFTNPFPIVISYTTNSGNNWSSVSQINNSLPSRQSTGPVMAVGTDGTGYVSWSSALLVSPFNEKNIGFAVSQDGGISWTVNENIYACNGVKTSSLSPWNIRVNGYPSMDIDKTGGSRNDWIYIVTSEKDLAPAGSDPDIVFHRSSDRGNTWSAGVRVNQDALNNGKNQIFPAITVDANGGINVIYMDNRNSPDSAQIYLSRSTDGGDNWTDYIVSDHKFLPKSLSGAGSGNQGDNIGITHTNNKLFPVWNDDITGVYQVWTAPIDLSTIGINQISSEIPAGYSLSQNYPNPFNPKTVINFQISAAGSDWITLKVYDALGTEVRTLADQRQSAGSYSVEFDGTGLPSGVYFYRLQSSGFTDTRRMILLK